MYIPLENLTATPTQKEAIIHPQTPLMILAGAGTGKTFTLENRIVYLIKHYNVKPEHILTITYTEKAAGELQNRLANKIGQSVCDMTIGTFHSFCFRLLKDYKKSILPYLLEESEAIHMFLENYDELGPFYSEEFSINPQLAVIKSFIPFFNRLRDELIDIERMTIPLDNENNISAETIAQLKDLKRIYPIFQKWKRDLNVVDYGDMILLCYQILQKNEAVLKIIQDKYRHVIIDEFQDNNFALNKIINYITEKQPQITVVGDENQTIYSFRGANSYNITEFKTKYKTTILSLEENFRSTQSILNLANASINKNTLQKKANVYTKKNPMGSTPKLFWGEKNEQLEFMSYEIRKLLKQDNQESDIAVLCRTNSQAEIASNLLLKAGLSVQPRIPAYFNIPAILDVTAWCQIIGSGLFQDNGLYRLIRNTSGEETAFKIYSLFDKRDNTPRYELISNDIHILNKYPSIRNLVNTISSHRKILARKPAGEVVWEICEKNNLLKNYNNRYDIDDKLAILNISDYLRRAQLFSKRNPKDHNLKAFNKYIEAIIISGGLRTIVPEEFQQLKGIRVSTIHSVKGAEFSIVFLPFLRSGSFPLHFRSKALISHPPDEWLTYLNSSHLTQKEHHLEEERRLFYVAVTRAKTNLYILAPHKATSVFVKEIPEHLTEEVVMKEHTEKKSYSDLRINYEQKLQKALVSNQFNLVHDYTNALEFIQFIESGKDVQLGDSQWEQELQNHLKGKFEPVLNEKLHLSASAIETYESCPLKYRFNRLDSIPQAPGKPQLVFGNIIHSVLQRFHEPEKSLTETRILRLLNEEWKSGEFDYTVREKKFFEQGKDILTRYVCWIIMNPPNVLAREEIFSFELGDITINGAIDRIDKVGSGTHIVDYKTSKTSKPAKSNLQLSIYSMYLNQSDSKEYGGLPEKASLHFLRDEEKPLRSHSFTLEDLQKTTEKIKQVAAGIRNKEFPSKKGKHCDWCDYKNLICPEWENQS